MPKDVTIVVGLGEVGGPLCEILGQTYDCVGVDIDPIRITQPCSVLHICIPYQIPDFVRVASEYIAKYKPQFTVINSTVAPGTTRAVAASSRSRVVYSPVRGKHARMQSEMLRYRKFVGADDPKTGNAAIPTSPASGSKQIGFPVRPPAKWRNFSRRHGLASWLLGLRKRSALDSCTAHPTTR